MCEQKTNVVELELEELALVNGGGGGGGHDPDIKFAILTESPAVPIVLKEEINV